MKPITFLSFKALHERASKERVFGKSEMLITAPLTNNKLKAFSAAGKLVERHDDESAAC